MAVACSWHAHRPRSKKQKTLKGQQSSPRCFAVLNELAHHPAHSNPPDRDLLHLAVLRNAASIGGRASVCNIV